MDVDLLDVESAVGREEQLVLARCRRILGTDVIDVVARHLWGGVGRGYGWNEMGTGVGRM